MDKCKYHSYTTMPARVFFEIRETGNFQLMCAKNGVKDAYLSSLFSEIYDQYFVKSDNPDAKRYVDLQERIVYLKFRKASISKALSIIWQFPREIWNTKQGRQIWAGQVHALNKLLENPINPDSDNIIAEFEATTQIDLGIIENDISECMMELEQMRSGNTEAFDFDDALQNINEWNAPQATASNCMLSEYVAAEKSASKKAKRQQLKEMQNG